MGSTFSVDLFLTKCMFRLIAIFQLCACWIIAATENITVDAYIFGFSFSTAVVKYKTEK